LKNILIIIQRSNGDVFFANTLIQALYSYYKSPNIDLLINDDTFNTGRLIENIREIILFSYKEKRKKRWKQEFSIIKKIRNKYDLSINLTASDRSVIYALLSAKKTISAVEKSKKKSWWKKILLSNFYFFDSSKHIVENNFKSLKILGIKTNLCVEEIHSSDDVLKQVQNNLSSLKINQFLIFHPSAQYDYKVYNRESRSSLLKKLSGLGLDIVVTGGFSEIDNRIKSEIPELKNIHNLIGSTSIEEFIAFSKLSLGFIGMDTLNLHIAASQNKKVFAIYGPTNINMWSPWSNDLGSGARFVSSVQKYGKICLFQADMPCVPCGKAGCNNNFFVSECLSLIDPNLVFSYIEEWYSNL